MDKFVLVLAAALCFSTSAIAEVTCHTNAFGDVNCTGYDKDGHYVNTTYAQKMPLEMSPQLDILGIVK